jgi:hypothetical protein
MATWHYSWQYNNIKITDQSYRLLKWIEQHGKTPAYSDMIKEFEWCYRVIYNKITNLEKKKIVKRIRGNRKIKAYIIRILISYKKFTEIENKDMR